MIYAGWVFEPDCDGQARAPRYEGLSRLEQKRSPPPETLIGALQDRIHPASGRLIKAEPVKRK